MLEKIPCATDGFELEEIDGEILLYSPSSTRSVYLNATASLIWRLCDGKRNVRQIVDQLKQAFPEAEQSIEQDVTKSIQLFVDNDAIQLEQIS
ncbi:MAG: pyrroloquinoline quinone biosynthesis peptide chaperone PqqD [Arenicellales bacterium]|jgi:coenzyme PQQ biosynthesis protein PqqD